MHNQISCRAQRYVLKKSACTALSSGHAPCAMNDSFDETTDLDEQAARSACILCGAVQCPLGARFLSSPRYKSSPTVYMHPTPAFLRTAQTSQSMMRASATSTRGLRRVRRTTTVTLANASLLLPVLILRNFHSTLTFDPGALGRTLSPVQLWAVNRPSRSPSSSRLRQADYGAVLDGRADSSLEEGMACASRALSWSNSAHGRHSVEARILPPPGPCPQSSARVRSPIRVLGACSRPRRPEPLADGAHLSRAWSGSRSRGIVTERVTARKPRVAQRDTLVPRVCRVPLSPALWRERPWKGHSSCNCIIMRRNGRRGAPRASRLARISLPLSAPAPTVSGWSARAQSWSSAAVPTRYHGVSAVIYKGLHDVEDAPNSRLEPRLSQHSLLPPNTTY